MTGAPIRRSRLEWDGAVSAGLGAGFGFVLFQASLAFWNAHWPERLDNLLAIVLVALAVIRFLEPLAERLRSVLGVAEEHPPVPAESRRLLRTVAFVTLSLASVSHALLHDMIKENPWGAFGIVVVALLIPGGITYAWMVGAQQDPPRAAKLGALTGALLGGLHLFFFFLVLVVIGGLGAEVPRPEMLDTLERSVLVNGLAWGALGLAGGLVIDRRAGVRPAWSVAAALILIALLLDIPALWFPTYVMYGIPDFAKIAGWGLGLIAYPRSNLLFAGRSPAPR